MSKKKETIGVLVMSYGTPESMEQIEAYYTHIRRGNPPTPEQLAELTERYEAIACGIFPLRENTNHQVAALEAGLNSGDQTSEDVEFRCFQGLKHARPFIEDGVQEMAQSGISRGIGIVLAPHYSSMSVGSYIKRAEAKAQELGVQMTFIQSYHMHPTLISTLADRVKAALLKFEENAKHPVRVLFTAHSLPESILSMGDPYVEQLHESSQAVAEAAGVSRWQFAWQSAGRTSVPWLGPDITDVLQSLRKEEDVRNVLICPIGFVSDHLEVLYDIDIECQQVAAQLNMHLERTQSLNSDPQFIDTLCDVIVEQANKLLNKAEV